VVEAVISMLHRWSLMGLLAFPSIASAHRLDECLQATLVAIAPDSLRLEINLTPGVDVANQVLSLIDPDGDGVISASESAAYAERVKRDLQLRVDQHDVSLTLTASQFPEVDEMRSGFGIIQLEFTATPATLEGGAHQISFENHHQPSASVYLFNATKPKSDAVKIIRQTRNRNQSQGEISFSYQSPVKASNTPGIIVAVVASLVAVFSIIRRLRQESADLPKKAH
jgi:hypothetical protein